MTSIVTAAPSTQTMWRIGGSGPGPLRFNPSLPLSGATRFEVGVSDPDTDWPRMSAGPLDDSSSYTGASFEIAFDLPAGAETDAFRLHLTGLEGSGPMPDFTVAVGDRAGYFAVQRERRDRRHAPLPPGPTAGLFRFDMIFRPGDLREGRNLITIRTAPVAPSADHGEEARQDRRSPGSWFGNTWQWRSLSLDRIDDEPDTAVELVSLPLYIDAGGEDRALLALTVRGGAEHPDFRVAMGGRVYDAQDAVSLTTADFGDIVAVLAVDEFEPLDAVVSSGGREWTISLRPARKWTVHVIPHVHLDLGYTDHQAKITEIHALNVDRARTITAQHPDFRFTLDGTYIADAYERSRKPAAVAAFHEELMDGRLGLNAFWATPLSGTCSREELVRGLWDSVGRRRSGTAPARSANLTDVPSYTGALPSILAGAGIDRFFGIANHMRGGNADSDELHLVSPVRWQGPDGGEVSAFFADAYTQLRTVCSDQPSVTGAATGLTRLLERYERDDYPHIDLPLYGTHADNEDLGSGYADLVERWSGVYSWPRLRFSTIDDYFDAIEAHGGDLPKIVGESGGYWEDGVGTAPQLHAQHRALQVLLPEVEAVSALLALDSEVLRPDLAGLDAAWRGVLVGGEHTFTASYSTDAPGAAMVQEQLAWKESQVARSTADARDLRLRAMAQLADQIDVATLPSVLVVNPLSWPRTAEIEVELPAGHGLADGRGGFLAGRALSDTADGRLRWRITLPELPAFGYRAFAIEPVVDQDPARDAIAGDGDIQIGSYVVRFASGRVVQLTHRETGRRMLDESAQRLLADVVVADGGGTPAGRGRDTERTSLWDYDPELVPTSIVERVAAAGPVTVTGSAAGDIISWPVSVPGVIDGTVDISINEDIVDVRCRLHKQPELAKQSVYVAFPFATEDGTSFDRQQGWFDPTTALPGACVEWFTLHNVAVLGRGRNAVAFASKDAALVAFDEPVRADWRTTFERRTGTVLSWVTNNYWWTNTMPTQSGALDLSYRFAPIEEREAAVRMGRELRSAVWVSDISVADRRDPWPRTWTTAGSLLDFEAPANIDITVFPARFHEGAVLIRIQEIADRDAVVPLPAPVGAGAVRECNDVEDLLDTAPLDGQISLRASQVRSFLYTPGSDA